MSNNNWNFSLLNKKELLILYKTDKTVERIRLIAKQKNISTGKMLLDCNLNKNTLNSMETRGSWISSNKLGIIADYLDCSVDYLLGREQKFTSSELTDKEQEILSLFKNNLSESQRDMVLERAKTLAEMNAPNITLEQTVPVKAVAYGAANTDTKMTVEQQQSVERRIKKLKNKAK